VECRRSHLAVKQDEGDGVRNSSEFVEFVQSLRASAKSWNNHYPNQQIKVASGSSVGRGPPNLVSAAVRCRR
jgi:hypothetical protein